MIRRTAQQYGMSAAVRRCRIQLHFGNITKEITRAVVNSVGNGVIYKGDECAKSMAVEAGDIMVREFKRKRSSAPNKDLVVTSAGDMIQEKILHVIASNDPNKMADIIRRTLREAESEKLDSIAFPALGTGSCKGDPKNLAVPMFEAMRDFAQEIRPIHLHFMKVTISQTYMFAVYKEAMQEVLGPYTLVED